MKKNNVIPRARQGFTFIEILLAVTIISCLAGSLYAAFAAGMKLEQRANKSFRDLDENRMITEQLIKDLGRAVSYDFRGSIPDRKSFASDGSKFVFLIDDKGDLKWVCYSLVSADQGQVKETRLGIVTDHNVQVSNGTSRETRTVNLARDENDFVHFFDATAVPQNRDILSKRVPEDGWNILFAQTLAGQPQVEWKTGWDELFLPAAVRVNFILRSENGTTVKFSRDLMLPAGGQNAP